MLKIICRILGHRWNQSSHFCYVNREAGLAAIAKTCARCGGGKTELDTIPYFSRNCPSPDYMQERGKVNANN